MLTNTFRIALFLLTLLLTTSAFALDCTPLKPRGGDQTNRQMGGKIKGAVDGLFAKLAGIDVELEGAYRDIREDVLKAYPDADRLYIWERLIFLQCEVLKDTSELTDREKIDQLNMLMEKMMKGPPPEPTSGGKQILDSYQFDVAGEPIVCSIPVASSLNFSRFEDKSSGFFMVGVNLEQLVLFEGKPMTTHNCRSALNPELYFYEVTSTAQAPTATTDGRKCRYAQTRNSIYQNPIDKKVYFSDEKITSIEAIYCLSERGVWEIDRIISRETIDRP